MRTAGKAESVQCPKASLEHSLRTGPVKRGAAEYRQDSMTQK